MTLLLIDSTFHLGDYTALLRVCGTQRLESGLELGLRIVCLDYSTLQSEMRARQFDTDTYFESRYLALHALAAV